MSLSVEHARDIVEALGVEPIPNFISQAKAKKLLQEVHELPENFPAFTDGLDDRSTFIAYRMLSAGCSLVELGQPAEGYQQLHAAGDLLESTHRQSAQADSVSGFHCLIGAMAFYSCGHYSRAFVLISATETATAVAGVVACFLRKDFSELIPWINDVLLQEQIPADEGGIEADKRALEILITRSIALILEHAISGESEYVAEADQILADAMIISEAGANPSFWWIARILRLMLKGYGQGSLWNCLPPLFGPDGKTAISDYTSLLALSEPAVTELWRSQLSSLDLALDNENAGGVVNLRTSSGKTRVAELAVLKELRADPASKVLYLAPFRSLAFELERSFGRFLGGLGYSISHLYGGSRFSGIDRDMVLEANLLIATPEKTKAMLRAAPELFDSVKLIVVDEGHLLGGSERNVKNELFLEHLRLLSRNQGARILLLSAVLPNAAELATWIGGDEKALAQSDWKPSDERFGVLRWTKKGVQIEWRSESRCFNPDFVEFRKVTEPGKKNARKFPSTKTEAVAASAVRLAEIGPTLIFAGQAQWVPSMAKSVMLALQGGETTHQWPDTEWRIFQAVCGEELGADCIELEAARFGIVCHSNSLPPQVRIAVENLMAAGTPKVIVATTTLGQGVNIGVSSVIVSQTLIGQNRLITKRDFWNICGRAGRAYVDGEGKVLFAIDATKAGWQIQRQVNLANQYLDILKIDKVESGLLQVIRILKRIALETGIDFEVFLELVANRNYESLEQKADSVRALTDLLDDQLLALHVAHKGTDPSGDQIDWIEGAFQGSLAAIQAEANEDDDRDSVLSLLKARTTAVLGEVPEAPARQAIISSGLPLSVGKLAYQDLEFFRKHVDAYLASDQSASAVAILVSEFEEWARAYARSMCGSITSKAILDLVRPQWLRGTSLLEIRQSCEEDPLKICTDFYGYELSWLFHAVAQKLDVESEEERREALTLVSLLLELGLPNQAASKVFLAGIRSRSAAVELGAFVVDATANAKSIRNALLNLETVEKLRPSITPETSNWLDLLAKDQTASTEELPSFSNFKLETPPGLETLHSRKLPGQDTAFLCSTDCRFVFGAESTDELPFDTIANDSRFIFLRCGEHWRLHCRDPRLQAPPLAFDDWIF